MLTETWKRAGGRVGMGVKGLLRRFCCSEDVEKFGCSQGSCEEGDLTTGLVASPISSSF